MKEENFKIETLGLPIGNILSVFDGIQEKVIKISEIEHTMKHAKVELSQIYDLRSDFRDKVYNYLKRNIHLIQEGIETLESQQERLDLLHKIDNIINSVFGIEIHTNAKDKLILNMSKSAIYDLFRQLKNMTLNGKEKILPQTNEALAEFLINNVEGFEDLKKETIAKEISRTQPLKKGKLVITKEL